MTSDSFTLHGKVALVTGAGGGIGAACVRELAGAGAGVMATDIDLAACATVSDELTAAGHAVRAMAQDVCDESRWERIVAATIADLGGFDILVNNAGIYVGGLLETNNLEDVQRVHRINVESIFLGMKYAAAAMKPGGPAGRGGSIINMSSVAGLIGVPGHTAYGSTKGAVRLYTKHAAAEFGALGYGIRVNSVHPGLIETAMGAQLFADFVDCGLAESEEQARGIIREMTCLDRLGQPEEIAHMVRFLASNASSYITGAEMIVDGGASAK